MSSRESSVQSLNIFRFHSFYRIAQQHPNPARLRDQLDRVSSHLLGRALAQLPLSLPEGSPRSVCFIRRLQLSLIINGSWSPSLVASQWARELAGQVEKAISDPDSCQVVRFESPESYQARFLIDLVQGQAWSRWFYRRFQGLKALPLSAALRTLLCDEEIASLDVLSTMSPEERAAMTSGLTERDAQRVLEKLSAGGSHVEVSRCLTALLATVQAKPGPRSDSESRKAFRVYVECCLKDRSLIGPDMRSASLAWCRLERLARGREVRPGRLKEVLQRGSLPDLHQVVNSSSAQLLAPWIELPGALIEKTFQRFKAEQDHQPRTEGAVRHTCFGGVFLLLPLLNEIPWKVACEGWPELASVAAESWTRLLVLIKCLGRHLARSVFEDGLVREVTGVRHERTWDELSVWLKQVGQRDSRPSQLLDAVGSDSAEQGEPSNGQVHRDLAGLKLPPSLRCPSGLDHALSLVGHRVLRSFCRLLPGFHQASLEHVRRNFLNLPASLEEQSHRRVVLLGSPPLDVVLRMTGMTRQSYRLNWLDDRPFELFPEE